MSSGNSFAGVILMALSLMAFALSAEVQQVVITWNNVSCDAGCSTLLGERFQAMPQVQEVRMNHSTGTTVLMWKPQSPFTYRAVKTTMQLVGVGTNDIRVRVRGKAKQQGQEVILVSLEDNTPFKLISPTPPLPDEYTVKANPYFRTLSPDLRDRILSEATQDKVLVIEGPLYQPAKVVLLELVVERIQIEKQNK